MKDKEKYNAYHREYQRKYQLKKYHEWRIWVLSYLGGKCVVCGSIENLEIDHIIASEKEYNIASLFSHRKETQLKELAKCQLLCENHHIEKGKKAQDQPRSISKNKDIHGTGYMYIQKKCRCIYCISWKKLFNQKKIKYSERISDEQIITLVPEIRKSNEIIHGTRAGYLKEIRRKIKPCEICKQANAEYTKSRKA